MTSTFEDFDNDAQAWSDYCDEMAEARELEIDALRDDFEDYDPDADDWRESALTVGERQ